MLLQDIRYGVRMMLRKPGLTLAAILSLGLGIGATSVVFTWLKGVYLRPLPGVEDTSRMVTLNAVLNKRTGYSNSALDLAYYRQHNQVFEGLLAHEFGLYNISLQRTPEVISGGPVSANYFDLLGVKPHLGRTFRAEEDAVEGRDAVAVISHSLWRRKFSSDPSAIGQAVLINQVPFTIVGVAPEQFSGVYGGLGQDVWFPIAMQNRIAVDSRVTPQTSWFQIMARLKPGVTIEQAQANLNVMTEQMRQAHRKGGRLFSAQVYPIHKAQRGLQSGLFPFVAVLGIVVGLVLLIACLNVANLLLSRASERAREIGLRLALGASSSRLLRQLLTESLMLAAAGGFIGLLITFWLGGSLLTLIPMQGMPLGFDLRTDYRVLGFIGGITLLCGIGFGFAPAWMASHTKLANTLKEQSGGVIGGTRQRLRASLVVAQISLSLMALIGAGLFARSLRNALAADPGFQAGNAVIAQISPKLNQYTPERGQRLYSDLLTQLRQASGVRAASLTSFVPLSQSGGGNTRTYEVDGRPVDPDHPITVDTDALAPDFFATMGIPMMRGREFRTTEPSRVAIVNETFVKQFLNGREPLGARLRLGRDSLEIVGVCRDFKYRRLDEEPQPHAFLPILQEYSGEAIVVMRGDPGVLLTALRQTLGTLDPDMPIFRSMTLQENVAFSFVEQRLTAILLSAFSFVAVILAIVGLYAVMASFVGTRVREIGVRMALGADSGSILAMVMQRGILLVSIGVAIGCVLAGFLTRVVASMLFGVGAFDPVTFLATAALLVAVGAGACWLPARRAASVDPMTALRFD